MNEPKYIAALEISSSKIIGTVGRTSGDGSLDVIAVEQEKGVEWVRHGIIQNLEETSIRISRIISNLERKASIAPRKITSVYVGLSGRSLRNIRTEVKINLPEDTEINEEIVKRLEEDAWRTPIDNSLEIVDVVPRYYRIGKQETHSPIGVIGNDISAVFDLIVCRPDIRRNIERTVTDKLKLNIAGYLVTALATGHLILSNDEKRLGCMLVDLGAETTTATIYKDGNLVYYATIPLGSRNITRDLTSLNVLEEYAEEVKLSTGNAIASEKPSSLNISGLKFSDVSNIVVARSEEIVANIVEQIEYAGFKDKDLPGGIIGIGGGFKMNGMIELVSRQTNLPARRGRLPGYVHLEDTKLPASESIQVVSVLYDGATLDTTECLEMPQRRELPSTGEANEEENSSYVIEEEEKIEQPARRHPGFLDKVTGAIGKIFGGGADDDNDSDLY